MLGFPLLSLSSSSSLSSPSPLFYPLRPGSLPSLVSMYLLVCFRSALTRHSHRIYVDEDQGGRVSGWKGTDKAEQKEYWNKGGRKGSEAEARGEEWEGWGRSVRG